MTKKLTRSLNQRKIAGVCGGLGEYFKLDPVIFRFLFLLLCLPGGIPGPALYILCWISSFRRQKFHNRRSISATSAAHSSTVQTAVRTSATTTPETIDV